jgi:hypothetical protein
MPYTAPLRREILTAPHLSISEIQLARAISEFTGYPPDEASIATLEKRLNSQY